MRQPSSRNQRSKGGFRLKHALQICLLLAICTWLLYQVKHSHDKKRALEERISKISSKPTEQPPDIFNLGRKVLPLVKENDSMTEIHWKDEDEEEGQEVEQEQEQDTKPEETEDEEGKRGVDDGIDEQDQDQDQGGGEDEGEHDDEFVSQEEKDGQAEEDGLFDGQEHEDRAREAREENYKRDDASSAVAHAHDSHADQEADGVEARGLDEEQMENHENGDVAVESLERHQNGDVAMESLERTANHSNSTTASGESITLSSKAENETLADAMEKDVVGQKELQPSTTTATSAENIAWHLAQPAGFMPTKETPQVLISGLSSVHDQATVVNVTSLQAPANRNYKPEPKEVHEAEVSRTMSTTIEVHEAAAEGRVVGANRLNLPSTQDEPKRDNGVAAE